MSRKKIKWESTEAKCPFYRKESPGRIHCEGVVEGSSLILAFGDEEGRQRYCKYYCEFKWKCCRVAAMLDEKYEEEEE